MTNLTLAGAPAPSITGLVTKTRLGKKSRAEAEAFFRSDVVTFERIRRVVVGTKGKHSFEEKEVG